MGEKIACFNQLSHISVDKREVKKKHTHKKHINTIDFSLEKIARVYVTTDLSYHRQMQQRKKKTQKIIMFL